VFSKKNHHPKKPFTEEEKQQKTFLKCQRKETLINNTACKICMEKEPLVLIIRDGWGYREEKEKNALKEVPTPNTDALMQNYPNTLLSASGEAVGLPPGYQGNSEVGHITIGSGRVLMQSLSRINKTISNGSFFNNESFKAAINHAKERRKSLHLIGLMQKEGVHSHLDHLFALLDLCKELECHNVKLHIITDGRDAPVTKSELYIKEVKEKIKTLGFGEIVSLSGRYYAMDRDNRWERTQKFYDTVMYARGNNIFTEVEEEILRCHSENETDEFIKPRIKEGYQGVEEEDSIIFFNFRTDRPRQFTRAVVEEEFKEFPRKNIKTCYVAMTKFYSPMNARIAFEDQNMQNILGELISKNNLKQLRISETEKYAHVTFFFNAEREEPYDGEERILIPSPKVATYDLKPEMSAEEITNNIIKELEKDKFDVIITNIVNGDMVGHTGITEACHKAVTTVDACLGRIVKATLEKKGTLLICADHGNIEDQTDEWRTSHTINKIPFILVSSKEALRHTKLKEKRGLQDIAPTILELLNIPKPSEMSGESLINK
jgi:2,3-bisphosphoglycerate-independent phosphoglycerate mutase